VAHRTGVVVLPKGFNRSPNSFSGGQNAYDFLFRKTTAPKRPVTKRKSQRSSGHPRLPKLRHLMRAWSRAAAATVPEPSTTSFMLVGFAVSLGFVTRRRVIQ
jgi:hypothetical protein